MALLLVQAVGRWLHFAGYALAFGPIAFRTLVVQTDHAGAHTGLQRLSNAGILLLLVAEPITIFSAGLGPAMALRAGAPVLLWAFQGALERARARQGWPLLLLGLALAVVDGGGPVPALHIAAMGLWVGGLASLLTLLTLLRGHTPERAALVSRFGRLAALAVALLAATGTLLAHEHLNQAAELFTSPWGRVLILKLVGVAIALAMAGRRIWHGELLTQMLLLALAALLASVPSPR